MELWLKTGLVIGILMVVGLVILSGLHSVHGVRYSWKLPDFTNDSGLLQFEMITFYIVELLTVFVVGLHGGVAVYGIIRFIKFLKEGRLFTGNIKLPSWKKGASIGFFLSCLINFLIVLIFGFLARLLNVTDVYSRCGHYGCFSDYIFLLYPIIIAISDLIFVLLGSLVGFLFGLTAKYKQQK